MIEKIGDITTARIGVIIQQVNCQAVMASGVAKAIREKYPQVYEDYMDMFETHWSGNKEANPGLLGGYVLTKIDEHLSVASIFGQVNYGRDGAKYTSYDALDKAFRSLSKEYPEEHFHSPMIGSGLGGGNWEVVKPILVQHFHPRLTIWYPK